MKTIILILLIIYLLYTYSNRSRHEQTGGAKIINNAAEITVGDYIFKDREEYFKYEKGDYPYLNKITQQYQEANEFIEKKREKIAGFVDEYQRTKELLKNEININSLYTPADIKRKEHEAEELRDTYNRHLNLFLELADLNNQLIVYALYSQKKSSSSLNIKRSATDNYRQKMKDFLLTQKKLRTN